MCTYKISSFQKIECPIAIKWELEEDQLTPLKDLYGEGLVTEWFEASNIPGVQYRLKLYPNGNCHEYEGDTVVLFGVSMGKETKVHADIKFSIESAGWSSEQSYECKATKSRGVICCGTDELFYPDFLVDGTLTIKCEGMLIVEKTVDCDNTWKMQGFLASLWSENETDFTIVVDGKSIKVSIFYIQV